MRAQVELPQVAGTLMVEPEIAEKAEFARLCNVHPSRVSHWIREKKITGDALVGAGRGAKIHVARARAQLRLRRDVGQAIGNGLDTKLAPNGQAASTDQIDELLKQARLEALERRNRVEAEQEARSQGRLTDTASARREMGRVAEQMLRVFEGALPIFATAVHSRFQIEQREVLLLLREEFRSVRANAAGEAANAAAGRSSLVPDPASEE